MAYNSAAETEPQPDTDEISDGAEGASLSDEEIIEQAMACLQIAEDAESDTRKLALEDTKFSAGEQWPDDIQQDRRNDGRPCLVVNRIPQFVQQITNDQRQNRPAIKVHPVDDGADEDTANVIQGLIRHIEYNSNAEVAYDTGFDGAARGGFGFWRVVTSFVSPDSFDQEIYIKRIRDAFSVYLDPSAQEPDGSDANWGLVIDYLTHDEFTEKYPDAEQKSLDDFKSVGDRAPDWMRDGSIRIAEYFYRTYKETTLHLLSTGETVLDEKLEERLQAAKEANLQVGIVKSRKTKIPTIKWVKLNAIEILERTDWPGKYIPIIPVYGNEIFVDGKRTLEGIVRHAKDPQRMLNYWKSAQTEAIALAPRAPFIGAEGQFEGHEAQWTLANRKNNAYLEYKPTTILGQPAPPPQRQAFEPAVQAITQASMQAADDLKATTGIYDPSLGAGPADTSGIAIQRRNMQSQTTNFHFIDNLTRSMRHTGRILIDLIPYIYDTARSARIIGEDGTQKIVKINQEYTDENGKQLLYQLDTGTYDVTVDVGPSFASKRQEAAASMLDLSKAYPPLMQIAGDILVKNMDWPGAQDIADRIKRSMPPNLVNDPAQGPQQLPPQVQAQMQQMQTQVKQLAAMYHAAQDQLDQKKPEIESRERIELAKLQTQASIEIAKLNSKEGIALLEQQVDAIKHSHSLLVDQLQTAASLDAGGSPADAYQEAAQPTGGQSPGQPMEGQ